jgi:hypothetical protein
MSAKYFCYKRVHERNEEQLHHKTNPYYIRFIVVGIAVVMHQVIEKSKIRSSPWSKWSKVTCPNEKGIGPSPLKSVIEKIISIPVDGLKFRVGKDIGKYIVAGKKPSSI